MVLLDLRLAPQGVDLRSLMAVKVVALAVEGADGVLQCGEAGAESPVGKAIAKLRIKDVAAMKRDELARAAAAEAPPEHADEVAAHAEEVWTAARRVAALANAARTKP